jgi:hypothetical protein
MVYLVIVETSLTEQCGGNVFNVIVRSKKDMNVAVTVVPVPVLSKVLLRSICIFNTFAMVLKVLKHHCWSDLFSCQLVHCW